MTIPDWISDEEAIAYARARVRHEVDQLRRWRLFMDDIMEVAVRHRPLPPREHTLLQLLAATGNARTARVRCEWDRYQAMKKAVDAR